MQQAPLDFGLIFAALDTLLLKQTGIARHSYSELFLKLFRQADPGTYYSPDHAIFRKIRDDTLNQDELLKSCKMAGIDISSDCLDHLNDVPLDQQGAWCLLYSLVQGIKYRVSGEPELLCYLEFILAHCETERDLIRTLRGTNQQECTEKLSSWLLLDSQIIGNSDPLNKVNHAAAVIFYWAALYEKYLHTEYGDLEWKLTENQSPSILLKYLPKFSKKSNKVINSNWCFIETYKDYLIKEDGNKIFDADLYRAICEFQTNLQTEPNEEAIQRMFKKIKTGESPLTVKFVLENLIPLEGREIPSGYQWDSTLMIIHFLNLFTKLQTEAIKSGLMPSEVIELFGRYPSYANAVNIRYSIFQQSGRLVPA